MIPEVTEAQLQLLIGTGRDPVTGEPLGRAYPAYKSAAERVGERVSALDLELGPTARARAVAAIEAEESERGTRRAVAGYDFTFSIPKSASVLWAVADAGTQSLIVNAHHAAVAEVVAFMEREVAITRAGAIPGYGAVAQVDVRGLIATAYDHCDSRSGDPNLHTHVVISNKVQTVLDNKCRSLDGRPLHAATVTLSEFHADRRGSVPLALRRCPCLHLERTEVRVDRPDMHWPARTDAGCGISRFTSTSAPEHLGLGVAVAAGRI